MVRTPRATYNNLTRISVKSTSSDSVDHSLEYFHWVGFHIIRSWSHLEHARLPCTDISTASLSKPRAQVRAASSHAAAPPASSRVHAPLLFCCSSSNSNCQMTPSGLLSDEDLVGIAFNVIYALEPSKQRFSSAVRLSK